MPVEFRLPDIGEGLADAEIGKWLVRAGEEVKAEQPFVEIETEKVTVQIPAPMTARVAQLLAREGDVVPIGKPICIFEEIEAQPSGDGKRASAPPQAPRKKEVLATPAVRQFAREAGVDLSLVTGTGAAGRVTRQDVENFQRAGPVAPAQRLAAALPVRTEPELQLPPAAPPALRELEERVPIRGIRRRVATKMSHSLQATAQASYGDEVDVSELVRLREEAKGMFRDRGVHLTYMPFLIRAIVRVLKDFPHLNASVDDERGEIVVKHYYNLGIAIHTEEGLVVPVVNDADKKTITDLALEVQQLAERARAGRLTLNEVRNSTFTITNPGVVGGLFSTPILNYPEVGILGMHKIIKRPVVYEGQIVIRDMMNLVLTFDHRIIDGMVAARFVQSLKRLLEAPGLLLLEGA